MNGHAGTLPLSVHAKASCAPAYSLIRDVNGLAALKGAEEPTGRYTVLSKSVTKKNGLAKGGYYVSNHCTRTPVADSSRRSQSQHNMERSHVPNTPTILNHQQQSASQSQRCVFNGDLYTSAIEPKAISIPNGNPRAATKYEEPQNNKSNHTVTSTFFLRESVISRDTKNRSVGGSLSCGQPSPSSTTEDSVVSATSPNGFRVECRPQHHSYWLHQSELVLPTNRADLPALLVNGTGHPRSETRVASVTGLEAEPQGVHPNSSLSKLDRNHNPTYFSTTSMIYPNHQSKNDSEDYYNTFATGRFCVQFGSQKSVFVLDLRDFLVIKSPDYDQTLPGWNKSEVICSALSAKTRTSNPQVHPLAFITRHSMFIFLISFSGPSHRKIQTLHGSSGAQRRFPSDTTLNFSPRDGTQVYTSGNKPGPVTIPARSRSAQPSPGPSPMASPTTFYRASENNLSSQDCLGMDKRSRIGRPQHVDMQFSGSQRGTSSPPNLDKQKSRSFMPNGTDDDVESPILPSVREIIRQVEAMTQSNAATSTTDISAVGQGGSTSGIPRYQRNLSQSQQHQQQRRTSEHLARGGGILRQVGSSQRTPSAPQLRSMQYTPIQAKFNSITNATAQTRNAAPPVPPHGSTRTSKTIIGAFTRRPEQTYSTTESGQLQRYEFSNTSTLNKKTELLSNLPTDYQKLREAFIEQRREIQRLRKQLSEKDQLIGQLQNDLRLYEPWR
ncbi:uncharacterized protein DEA37_0012302 [Paragonimus westermani]|uniref:Uncharacterized protein n=1 Tax=Paragonimus westermani TaxID=34504 RepID=A0A5J4NY58_9TREM|nr:uncharacterized protein DEA37_0012302 [Paragonimus westermani]